MSRVTGSGGRGDGEHRGLPSFSSHGQRRGGRGRGGGGGRRDGKQPASPSSSSTSSSFSGQRHGQRGYRRSLPSLPPDPSEPASSRQQPVLDLPRRNGRCGTVGKSCYILANHVHVKYGKEDPHKYLLRFVPPVGSAAFDGTRVAYSAGPLPFTSRNFHVTTSDVDGHEQDFRIGFVLNAQIQLTYLTELLKGEQDHNPREAINALNVVLKEASSLMGRVRDGPLLFSSDFGNGELGNGIEYWNGLFQSLRPTQIGLSLNIDVAAKAFYKSVLVTEFVEYLLGKNVSRDQLTYNDRIRVRRELRNVKVQACYGDERCYTVQGLTEQPLSSLMVEDVPIIGYLAQEYNLIISWPNLPAVQASIDAGPIIYFPMEYLKIVEGQSYLRTLNKVQGARWRRVICQTPDVRKNNIIRHLRDINYNETDLVNREFALHVEEQLKQIRARVLRPPHVFFFFLNSNSNYNMAFLIIYMYFAAYLS
ncbi:putative post-transcriptional gene silencing PAZ-Argonaute family [Helianthus debilis subsp. tardiflorus]